MGDILFCYRQGQFSSLNDALNTRGIYGVGIAATNPLEIFPDKSGHNKYGVVVCFPILLNNHLQLSNIQMHPNTIDLTPYNGNRNDALQHIPDAKHYKTLFGPHTIIILDYSQSEAQNKVPFLIFIHKCMYTSGISR